jgi:metallo-beta-lactamase class B
MLHLARAGALSLVLVAAAPAESPTPRLSAEHAAWNEAVPPFRIADGLYYVGARNISSYLIDTGAGLVLVDAGFEATAPLVLEGVRTLGFDPADIRYLLIGQAHQDHAGGLAAIKRLTGAAMVASRADGSLLERGGRGDPHFGDASPYPPVRVDRFVGDGDRLTLGTVTLTAHLTPGHTKGCTTWTMPVADRDRTHVVQFNCGTSVPGYKLLGDPQLVADYEATFAKLKRMPCDIPLNAHGQFFDLDAKRAALAAGATRNPFVDPAGCRRELERSEAAFRDRLAREKRQVVE